MFEAGHDQAEGLRRLFARRDVRVLPLLTPEGGGDQSTFAVNLGGALAHIGMRTLLLDGTRGGPLASQLGLKARYDLLHLINGESGFDRVALPARDGFWVMPAQRGLNEVARRQASADDLFGGFGRSPSGFEVIVACGSPTSLAPLLSDCAREVSLICGAAAWQVALIYRQIKTLHTTFGIERFRVIPCRMRSAQEGLDAHRRLADAAQRFLGVEVVCGGVIEEHAVLEAAEREQSSVFSLDAGCTTAQAFERMAWSMLDWPLPVFADRQPLLH